MKIKIQINNNSAETIEETVFDGLDTDNAFQIADNLVVQKAILFEGLTYPYLDHRIELETEEKGKRTLCINIIYGARL